MTARLNDIEALLDQQGLCVSGGLVPEAGDDLPQIKSLLMISPNGADFWPLFTRSSEYNDGAPDPIDRWSQRVLTDLAQRLGGKALFPFGGPPYRPFLQWAIRTGRAHSSAVGMLVHNDAGLWISYRGAIALPYSVALPVPLQNPCETCVPRPCLSACPVGALSDGYDTAACHSWLERPEADCMSQGCAVRRACPVGAAFGRLPEQSAFHMKSFHK